MAEIKFSAIEKEAIYFFMFLALAFSDKLEESATKWIILVIAAIDLLSVIIYLIHYGTQKAKKSDKWCVGHLFRSGEVNESEIHEIPRIYFLQ
jgi:hypothetical protein